MQHAIQAEHPRAFRRNYFIHSVGSAHRQVIEAYVAGQIGHHPMVDPRSQALLERYQIEAPEVDLSRERATSYGRFIYNLHLVLVNAGRWRETREDWLERTRRMILLVAAKKRHVLSRAAIVADHLH